MRHQQRAGAGIDEGARQARQRLRLLGAAGCRVAGRQDHPVGVELEGGNLGGRQIAIVELGLLLGRRQDQARLAGAFDLTRQRAVGGEVQHPVLGELALRRSAS